MAIKEVPPPEWHRGMDVFYLAGKGMMQLRDRNKEINLFRGPTFSREVAMKNGINIFGLDNFEIFVTKTVDYNRAKAEYRSKKLDKTCDISDTFQKIYHATEEIE